MPVRPAMPRRRVVLLALACLLAACGPKIVPAGRAGVAARSPVPTPGGTALPKPTATPVVAMASATPGAAIAGHATVSLADAGLVSDAGGGLVGKVKAPASLISDHGAGVVSNNGSGVVSNNGAGVLSNNGAGLVHPTYALAATLDEQPVAGVRVYLLDAAGRVVVGPDGTPLSAVTDAAGNYRLAASGARHELVVAADLGAKGLVEGIVGTGSTDGPDLDLISTLTTGYILDRYVATQKDPVVTLDRLPADVEADTRAKALGAFEAGRVPTPDDLAPGHVDATVDDLRKGDATLDGQLEKVKKILIVAGESDFGSGDVATAHALANVAHLAVAPDGTVYLEERLTSASARIWRLGADGRLATAAGLGTVAGLMNKLPAAGSVVDAAGLAIQAIKQLGIDATGRPFLVDGDGVVRLEEGGKARVLVSGRETILGGIVGASVGADDRVVLLEPGTDNHLQLDVPGAAAPIRTYAAGEDGGVVLQQSSGGIGFSAEVTAAAGPGFLAIAKTSGGPIERIDTTTGVLVPLAPAGTLDALGDVFTPASGGWSAHTPAGRDVAIAVPAGFTANFATLCLAPDGSAYVVQDGQRIFRLAGGTATRVAGVEAAPVPAGGFAPIPGLASPTATALGDTNDLYVLDTGPGQLLHVAADHTTSVVASDLATGKRLGRDHAGNLYVLTIDTKADRAQVLELAAGDPAHPSVLASFTGLMTGWPDMAVAPDGTVFTCQNNALARIVAGKPQAIETGGAPIAHLSIDATGRLWTVGNTLDLAGGGMSEHGVLGRYTPADGFVHALDRVGATLPDGPFAVDGSGRAYLPEFAMGESWRVLRFTPPATTGEPVIGRGAKLLAGQTADDTLSDVADLCFDTAGNLYLTDTQDRQVRRLAADQL